MPNLDDLFPSTYVSAKDLSLPSGGYREVRLRIASLRPEQLKKRDGEGDETKWIVSFERAQKGMILNRTNAETIAAAYGKNTDGWIGRDVVLFVMSVQSPRGGMTPAIRVRIPATSPAERAAADAFPPAASDDELDRAAATESGSGTVVPF